MAKFTYRGNPGYVHEFRSGLAIAPSPGDIVDLTDEEAATVGDDFEPLKTAKTDAPKGDDKTPVEG